MVKRQEQKYLRGWLSGLNPAPILVTFVIVFFLFVGVFASVWEGHAHPNQEYICHWEGPRITSIKSCSSTGGGFLAGGHTDRIYNTEAGEMSYYSGYGTGDILPGKGTQQCEWKNKQ